MRSGRPNFVFILADDLGYGDLGCFGRPDFATPNIDRLCSQGAKLTQAYANSCSCSPTRVALLSGRYQNRLPVGNYDPLRLGIDAGFPPEHPTLPSLLRRGGYATGLVGKWHLGRLPKYGPTKSGYDEFFGLMGGGIDYFSHDSDPLGGSTERVPDLFEQETPVQIDGYATDLFTERAIQFIGKHRAAPFLLSLHYTAPHWPWQAPRDPGGERSSDMHFEGGSPALYAEMVAVLDRGVGRVLDALRSAKLEENTVVVFTSDNGGERFSYQWPLRGAKSELFEGGIRVPTIVRWPNHITADSSSDQLVMSMDWLPTLLAAAGLAPDSDYPPDGINVLDVLGGARSNIERTVLWRTKWSHVARHGDWKYLWDEGHEYLFNLRQDEMEQANLRLHKPALCARLKSEYEQWNAGMAPIPKDAAFSRELWRKMGALEPRI